MSEHGVYVVRIGEIEKHPNGDKIGITKVGNYTCVVNLEDTHTGDLRYHVEPDYVLSNRPEYDFLGGHLRVKVKKLRGVISQGLLMPLPPELADAKEGDNVMEQLSITRYEPPIERASTRAQHVRPPADYPIYDVENWYKYSKLFVDGEPIVATCKIDGCNFRGYWRDGQLWLGSRKYWVKDEPGNVWWEAAKQNPWLEEYCKEHPEHTIYGEVYGHISAILHYGKEPKQYGMAVFDVMQDGQWLSFTNRPYDLIPHWVPVIASGVPYSEGLVRSLASGPSLLWSGHQREGCVIKPYSSERWDYHLGRVQAKLVSDEYFLLKEGKEKRNKQQKHERPSQHV